jgi:hypothetical protein
MRVVLSMKGFVMRPRFKFRLATLLVVTAMIAVAIHHLQWRYFTPSGVYQTTKNGSALLGILGVELKNGDSRSSVRRRLGLGNVLTDRQSHEQRRIQTESKPDSAREGYQENDVLICYTSIEGIAVVLQFRNDQLINHHVPEALRSTMMEHYENCTKLANRRSAGYTGPPAATMER